MVVQPYRVVAQLLRTERHFADMVEVDPGLDGGHTKGYSLGHANGSDGFLDGRELLQDGVVCDLLGFRALEGDAAQHLGGWDPVLEYAFHGDMEVGQG